MYKVRENEDKMQRRGGLLAQLEPKLFQRMTSDALRSRTFVELVCSLSKSPREGSASHNFSTSLLSNFQVAVASCKF